MSTTWERTARVPAENRTVILLGLDIARRVMVEQENRTVIIVEAKTTSAGRTVYATED